MTLSKVALLCLETNLYLINDLFDTKAVLKNKDWKLGEFHDLYQEYRKHPDQFQEYTGLSVETFDYVLQRIKLHLRHYIKSKRAITRPQKLFLTMRYLSHGMSFKLLAESYLLGRSTVAKTVYKTLVAIWKTFHPIYLPRPTQQTLEKISAGFYTKFQFPNCIGAIDEKRFKVLKPRHGSTRDYGNEKYYTLVLQAMCDADHNFIAIDFTGKPNDGHFDCTVFDKMMENNRCLPPPRDPPGSNTILPHVLAANELFPLKTYLMRPYTPDEGSLNTEKRIFNNRLSKANAAMECTFGIFSKKWGVLDKPLETNIEHAQLIIKVACVLHNLVRERDGDNDNDFLNIINNLPDNDVVVDREMKRNVGATADAIAVREHFKEYFLNNPLKCVELPEL